MAIGNWGSTITFEVNSNKALTFTNFKREVSGRWKSHPIIGAKPKQEFAGPEASSVAFDVTLSAEHGVNPRSTIKRMENAAENGNVDYLYIGGTKVGKGKMMLESMSETWDEVWNRGELVRAKMSLSFSEYH